MNQPDPFRGIENDPAALDDESESEEFPDDETLPNEVKNGDIGQYENLQDPDPLHPGPTEP